MKKNINVPRISMYAFIAFFTIFFLFPIYWAFITSFKTESAVLKHATYLPWVDFEPSLDVWKTLFTKRSDEVIGPFFNSVIIATTSSIFAVFFGTMAAYGLTRFNYQLGFIRNRDILLWFISQRMIPPVVTAFPIFLMFSYINLLDTHLGMIIVYTGFNLPLAIWLMRSFISQVPKDIEESAMIDGASRLRIFFQIVIPLLKPGIVATFLFCLVLAWNEFLFALILTFENAQTMPIMLAGQQSTVGTDWWVISALTILTIAPVTIIALSLQKYMTRGLILGALE